MKAKLPWILLALSVVLNLSFIGGAAYLHNRADHWRGMPSEERMERLADRFDLEGEQREKFMAITEPMGSGGREGHRAERERIREEVMDLLRRETLSREEVLALFEARQEGWIDHMAERIVRVHAFLWSLPEEKREEMMEMGERRGGGFFRHLMRP